MRDYEDPKNLQPERSGIPCLRIGFRYCRRSLKQICEMWTWQSLSYSTTAEFTAVNITYSPTLRRTLRCFSSNVCLLMIRSWNRPANNPATITHPVYMSRKNRNFKCMKSTRETNRSFDSCDSCKRLVHSRLHEQNEPKLLMFSVCSCIELTRSKLPNCSVYVSGVTEVHHMRRFRWNYITK